MVKDFNQLQTMAILLYLIKLLEIHSFQIKLLPPTNIYQVLSLTEEIKEEKKEEKKEETIEEILITTLSQSMNKSKEYYPAQIHQKLDKLSIILSKVHFNVKKDLVSFKNFKIEFKVELPPKDQMLKKINNQYLNINKT